MGFNLKKTGIIAVLFVVSLLVVFPVQMVKAQTTTVTVSPQTSTPIVGQTITINIELSNAQNLYGVDVMLNWNPDFLSLKTNQSFVDIKTYPNGILNDPVSVVQDTATQALGQYHLVATSYTPATGFSGSGTIATLKFTVTGAGQSSLTVSSTLANYDPSGSSAIAHTDVSGTVDATASSSSSSTSPTPTSTSSSSPSSTPSPTPTAPEFPLIATLSIVAIMALVAVVLSVKKIMKPTSSRIEP